MSDSEEWDGYEVDSEESSMEEAGPNFHNDPNGAQQEMDAQKPVDDDDDDDFTVTEKHLNQCAILMDAQSLMGHEASSGGISVRAAPNPIVELCVKIVHYPLSVRRRVTRMHRIILHLPDLKGMSRMQRDALSDSALTKAVNTHGVVPYAPLQLPMAKNSQQIFETTRTKNQGRVDNPYRFFVGSSGPRAPHVIAAQEAFSSLPSGPKAILTFKSRVDEVNGVLRGLKDAGLNMNGPYKVFAYEEVAGGLKFVDVSCGERCALHTRYAATSSCCNVTVDRLEKALESAANALKSAHDNLHKEG